MKTEAEFKTLFKKSVRAAKGTSISLAAPMLVGIPDLWVAIPGYLPILLEAKFLGEFKREKFSRKVPFTPMQVNWIRECDDVCPYSAMGLVGFYYKELLRAALIKYGTPLFYNFTQTFQVDCAHTTYNYTKKAFDIFDLFAKVPVPRIYSVPVMSHMDIQHGEISKAI